MLRFNVESAMCRCQDDHPGRRTCPNEQNESIRKESGVPNVQEYLRKNLQAVSKGVFVAPKIPEKKLNNAIKAFKFSGDPGSVIALYDNTLLGRATDGILFTGKQLIYRSSFGDPVAIAYSDIASVERVEVSAGDKKRELILLKRNDGPGLSLDMLIGCDYTKLASVMTEALTRFTEFNEEAQFTPLETMAEELKEAYVKVIVNMAFDNDGEVDQHELAELHLLINRISLKPETRFALRAYMGTQQERQPVTELLQIVDVKAPPGQVHSVHVSLVKDLLHVYLSTGGTTLDQFAFLTTHRAALQVSEGDIELAHAAIKNDRDMLRSDLTDDQVESALKVLAAKAAAVGTPLAAVYLSGSVIGMSAAGMTSGLATLGMGGALGLSSMATGIGVAVLLGMGAYAGVRHVTGADGITRSRRRELMLNEIIKQRQATIVLVVDDINYLSGKLNEVISKHEGQSDKIRQMMGFVAQLAKAGSVLTAGTTAAQGSVAKIHCASELDEGKLSSLTKEPTKTKIGEFIRLRYVAEDVELKDGEPGRTSRLVLMRDLSTADLQELEQAFDAIGYFKVGDVVAGAVSDAADKAKGFITGLFS